MQSDNLSFPFPHLISLHCNLKYISITILEMDNGHMDTSASNLGSHF